MQNCSLSVQITAEYLGHMCQTQAREPTLARNVIIVGPRDHIKGPIELALGLYHTFYFKVNFSCVCNIKIWLFQMLCLCKLKFQEVKHYISVAVNFSINIDSDS